MPNLFSKFTKKSRRRRRDSTPDGKSVALTEAGIRLLARKDYDALSMAWIAREAGCSVGALYARYPDKNAYLYRVIGDAFRSMTDNAKLVLDGSRWPRESGAFIAKQVVNHVTAQMTTPRAAGIIRATMKLATVKPLALDLFEDYHSAVTDRAVALLAGKSRNVSAGAVRVGMQIVLGAITDAVLRKHPGPMNAGSARMTAALTNILLGYLGLAHGKFWAGEEADGEDDPGDVADLGSETPPELGDGDVAIVDPDHRTFLGKRSGGIKARKSRPSRSAPEKSNPQKRAMTTIKRNESPNPAAKIPTVSLGRVPCPAARAEAKHNPQSEAPIHLSSQRARRLATLFALRDLLRGRFFRSAGFGLWRGFDLGLGAWLTVRDSWHRRSF